MTAAGDNLDDLAADVRAALSKGGWANHDFQGADIDQSHDPDACRICIGKRSLDELVARAQERDAIGAALGEPCAECGHIDWRSDGYADDLVARATAALTQENERLREALREYGAKPGGLLRIITAKDDAEAALAYTQHLHYLAEIEARDLRAVLADMRRALARVEQMALRGESGIISVVRRALAAADSGTAATCGKCRHPEHDPGECGFNVGTGYFGSVPCRCGLARLNTKEGP